MQPSLASKLRMALVMTLAVYPVVTLYLYILMPLTTGWDIWQRSLVLVPFMASTIVLLIVPFIGKHFGAFIAGKKKPSSVAA
jgi:antibiotic biosynthesis monooxygenase (ABM) superfamily enzyme